MIEWLDAHSSAVQAVTTLVLVAVTIYYAVQTQSQAWAARSALDEMRRTREAQARAFF